MCRVSFPPPFDWHNRSIDADAAVQIIDTTALSIALGNQGQKLPLVSPLLTSVILSQLYSANENFPWPHSETETISKVASGSVTALTSLGTTRIDRAILLFYVDVAYFRVTCRDTKTEEEMS